MKVISQIVEHYTGKRQKKCTDFQDAVCKSKEGCYCRKGGEIDAYIEATIPDNIRAKTLDDFRGECNGKRVLSAKATKFAREQLIKYCWIGIEAGEEYDPKIWFEKSAIDKRLKDGANVVIYGGAWAVDSSKNKVRTYRSPVGRTLVGALIMREAIIQRLRPSRCADTYEWVAYKRLTDVLMEHADGKQDYSDTIHAYTDADWLLIDGIEQNNDAGRSFRTNVFDKFLTERMESNKLNILIFQEDIDKIDDLQKEFGIATNTIINSRKTFRIPLVEGK